MELVHVQSRWAPDPANPHARVGFYYISKKFEGEPHNAEPDKCSELRYFAFDELPKDLIPHIRGALLSYKRGESYSEFDWHTL
jgi:hypothetical protein